MGVRFSLFNEGSAQSGVNPTTHGRYIVFVGRLVEKKGVEHLIRAMTVVRNSEPDVDLIIVGSGPLDAELRQLASDLKVEDSVHFQGALEHEAVASLLRGSSVACVPSIIDSNGETEGMPTVVLEAMASGSRVVGTSVDGIPDVLRDADNGWLVEPADSQSLAAGLLAALADPNGDEIASRAADDAERHDWVAVGLEYTEALQRAVGVR
jgi:glycosyltransferase involved in cell wall biosynthesis